MRPLATNEGPPWMVVSDLDGTILGNADATDRFRHWWYATDVPMYLVYSSGRHYSSVCASIKEFDLPTPDAIIADVGTDMRDFPSGAPFTEWSSRWWSNWQLDDICTVLDTQPELKPQPLECQSAFKRSYHVHNPPDDWLPRIRHRLRTLRLSADLIYSSDRDLDVLPSGANKGSAAEFLAQRWGIPRSRVLVAGDSGNDISMFVQGFRGIVVGNAQLDLDHLTGPNIYRSIRRFADGVIDGLEFWLERGPAGANAFRTPSHLHRDVSSEVH